MDYSFVSLINMFSVAGYPWDNENLQQYFGPNMKVYLYLPDYSTTEKPNSYKLLGEWSV